MYTALSKQTLNHDKLANLEAGMNIKMPQQSNFTRQQHIRLRTRILPNEKGIVTDALKLDTLKLLNNMFSNMKYNLSQAAFEKELENFQNYLLHKGQDFTNRNKTYLHHKQLTSLNLSTHNFRMTRIQQQQQHRAQEINSNNVTINEKNQTKNDINDHLSEMTNSDMSLSIVD